MTARRFWIFAFFAGTSDLASSMVAATVREDCPLLPSGQMLLSVVSLRMTILSMAFVMSWIVKLELAISFWMLGLSASDTLMKSLIIRGAKRQLRPIGFARLPNNKLNMAPFIRG